MNTPAMQVPLQWLSHLESLCLNHAQGLPQQEDTDDKWIGIGFRLGDLRLVSPLGEVVEILTLPELSRIPRTKPWVWGMANVRGNLLPITDLQGYLCEQQTEIKKTSRVLVVNYNGVYSGLVVDAVLGLKHFLDDFRCDELPADYSEVKAYTSHGFRVGNELWGVFSLHKLAETPQFLQAAV